MNTYIISDTFFGRKNIINIGKRKYSSVEAMDNGMIDKWNSVVTNDDIVYHLGNFAWDPFSANYALQNLNGKIKFLSGNKEKALIESISLYAKAMMLHDQILELPEFNVVLCHYPLEYWNGKEEGVIHLHGHNYKEFPMDLKKSMRVNVCADYWNLYPISINTIIELVHDYMTLE